MKFPTNFRALAVIGVLFLLYVTPLSAQNNLPNPNDASCWESLGGLRACALEQYNREQDYAQRCTSYPEYQCTPAPEPRASAIDVAKNKSKADKNVAVAQPSATDSIAATATSLPPDAK